MCYSGEMSACFGLLGVLTATYLKYMGKPTRFCLGIVYFAAMELLQTVQYWYIAEPEDGYKMCEHPINQVLTFLGYVHIVFQPVFCNMVFTGQIRLHSIERRIQGDLIHKLCLLMALSALVRYWLAVYGPAENLAARPSKDCPNYEWLRDGYDGSLGFETPNVPGHSCTFRSASESGHLAWAIPFYQPTYFVNGTYIHCFFMFAPIVLQAGNVAEMIYGTLFFLTGPALAVYLTGSLNEQPSIWCFFSFFQCLAVSIDLFFDKELPPTPIITHKGSMGEAPLEYIVQTPTMKQHNAANTIGVHVNGVYTNDTNNEKKEH